MRFERRRSFGRFQSRESFDEPKPVKAGEEYDVEISEVGAKGDGIARVNNFVVFVAGAKKGEKAKVKITEVRDRFAIGEKVGAGEATTEITEESVKEESVEEESVEEAKPETEELEESEPEKAEVSEESESEETSEESEEVSEEE